MNSANKADSPVLPPSGPVQRQEQLFFSHLHIAQRLEMTDTFLDIHTAVIIVKHDSQLSHDNVRMK